MQKWMTTLAVTSTLSLAACASQPVADAEAPAAPGTVAQQCNADAARNVIGQSATADIVEQARKAAGAAIARVLKPGQVVTMEYRGDRLDLDVDDANVVTGVRCG